uniref:Esterase n=1 Tax=uncultured bacterium TB310_p TaxID=1552140 RepID=A0A0K0LCF8_9BACT|nr:esterase [uncultured bacterium TB310_p]
MGQVNIHPTWRDQPTPYAVGNIMTSEPSIRPDVAAFLGFLNGLESPKMHEVSPEVARQMMTAMGPIAELPVGELAVIRDISISGPAGTIPARLYDARERRDAGPVMVFFHGGGFVIGDLDVYQPYCAEVARQLDIPVISVDYRLAPEHPFPAASDDCESAARWVAESPAELGLEVTGLVLSGDSAGGNLTIVTSMALRDKPAAVPVIVQYPIYPAVSQSDDWQSARDYADGYLLTADGMAWFFDHYNPVADDYRSTPLDHDQQGMPPTLLVTAGLDPLRDQGAAYAEALKTAGVPVEYHNAEGTIHGFINLRKALPSAQEDVTAHLALLKAMLNRIREAA